MDSIKIYQKLIHLEKLFSNHFQKEVMTADEVADYLGYKVSYIYKLTSANAIPFSKPNGKSIFFKRQEVIDWAMQNHSKSIEQIEREALNRL